jgi:thymidylate synthase (FAD)
MNITSPRFHILDLGQQPLLEKIETVGRVCYKSEDKICEGSAQQFVRSLIKKQHHAMLEHSSIILCMTYRAYEHINRLIANYEQNTGLPSFLLRSANSTEDRFVISGNIRAWRAFISRFRKCNMMPDGFDRVFAARPELFGDINTAFCSYDWYGKVWEISADELSGDEELLRHCPMTVKFTVDVAVARELCRHRMASHASSSTRYCDYSKGKFGSEITVVEPMESCEDNEAFIRGAMYAEQKYLEQRKDGVPPEIARSSLPLATMCEHVVTATLERWRDIFSLRALDKTGKAHPQMKRVMLPLLETCEVLYPSINWR